MNLDHFIEATREKNMLGVMAIQDGELLAEGYTADKDRRNIYSGTKSFTSAAVGLAVKEGLLSLDEKIIDCFPDDLPENPSDHLKSLRVRHLLSMQMGHDREYLMGYERPFLQFGNWPRYALAQEIPVRPGTAFLYDNVPPYLAGVLVERRAGCCLADYLYPRLFQPLGMMKPTWETDPDGHSFGAGGMMLALWEYARFGQLYAQGGVYQGRRILDEAWVIESAQKHAETREHGYGYLFWRGPHNSFSANGKCGQFSVIFPEKKAVIAAVSESRDGNAILNAIYELLYPQL
jgi:CubicO group peptidase (beta-lactamase class C family)